MARKMSSRRSLTGRMEFWQSLDIQIMRMAVRVALKSNQISLDTQKSLHEVAIFRELEAEGFTQDEMCLMLGCSPRTITNYSRRSREMETIPQRSGFLANLIGALRKKPMSARELGSGASKGSDLDEVEIALRLLTNLGFVEQSGDVPPIFKLSQKFEHQEVAQWKAPLSDAEGIHRDALVVLECLLERPATSKGLAADSRLRGSSARRLGKVLNFLKESGYVKHHIVGAAKSRRYYIVDGSIRIIPEDSLAQLRVALPDMLRKVGIFLDVALEGSKDVRFCQRSWLATIRPEDFRALVDELRGFVRERLVALEERARAGENGQPTTIIGMIFPQKNVR